jgi:hypothetical protein
VRTDELGETCLPELFDLGREVEVRPRGQEPRWVKYAGDGVEVRGFDDHALIEDASIRELIEVVAPATGPAEGSRKLNEAAVWSRQVVKGRWKHIGASIRVRPKPMHEVHYGLCGLVRRQEREVRSAE